MPSTTPYSFTEKRRIRKSFAKRASVLKVPFLLETLVAALVGVALAAATLSAFMYFIIYGQLRNRSQIVEWIDWGDAFFAVGGITAVGVLITLIPTLVMTRKYLKV